MIKFKNIINEGIDMDKIVIQKSPTADSRTCDVSKVTRDQLLNSSKMHIEDVKKGMNYIADLIRTAADKHDWTKIERIDQFYKDFKNEFKTQDWYDGHKQDERHHIAAEDGVRDDVDLVDVIEFLVDGMMAGLARSGEYRKEELPDGLLQKAFDNTVDKLIKVIEVKN